MRTSIRLGTFLALAFGTALSAACGGIEEAPLQEEAGAFDPIIGGRIDYRDPAIVAIFARSDPSSADGALCTGSLIAPRAILTAAHCVHPGYVPETAVFEVYTATDFTATSPDEALAVEAYAYHSDFNPYDIGAGHDIALIILAEPLDIEPLAIQRTRLPRSAVGQRVRQVGYGMDDRETQSGAGLKRETRTQLTAVTDTLLYFGDIEHTQCHGDSGGPTLRRSGGRERIIGVSSFGSSDGNCFGSFDTRVDAELDFIDEALEYAR
jgi:secreted trypsin-like serine protease